MKKITQTLDDIIKSLSELLNEIKLLLDASEPEPEPASEPEPEPEPESEPEPEPESEPEPEKKTKDQEFKERLEAALKLLKEV